jgi:hypothetical protein
VTARAPVFARCRCLQMVGFFVVEDRVQRSRQDVAMGLGVDAGWEGAIACLKSALEAAFDSLRSPSVMLAIKDFVLLACNALGASTSAAACVRACACFLGS